MIDHIKEERGEFLFLAGVAAFTILGLIETSNFMRESAAVPQIILYMLAAVLVAIVVTNIAGDAIKQRLGLTETSAGFETDDEGDDQLSGLYDLDLFGVTKEMGWISAYVLAVIYIGFFTTSAAFMITYILINETSELKHRIPLSIAWTGLILGMLYLLFVEFLRVSSVWRLGFLP